MLRIRGYAILHSRTALALLGGMTALLCVATLLLVRANTSSSLYASISPDTFSMLHDFVPWAAVFLSSYLPAED